MAKIRSNHASLQLQIMELKAEKFQKEEQIKHLFHEVSYSFQPKVMLKNVLFGILKDKAVQSNVWQMGLKYGSGLVISKLLRNFGGFKGMLLSFALNKIVNRFSQFRIR